MPRKNKKVQIDVLSAWGMGFDVLKALCDAAQARGHNPNDLLRSIVHAQGVRDAMVEAAIAKLQQLAVVSGPQNPVVKDGIRWFTVPSLRTATKKGPKCYREMRDAGGYGKVWPPADQDDAWAIGETAEPFTDLGIVCPGAHYGRDVTNGEVDAFLRECSVVDASSANLLNFGAAPATRDLQLQFPIVARGSVAVFNGYRHVLCLSASVGVRDLNAYYLSNVFWSKHCWFLVRKA